MVFLFGFIFFLITCLFSQLLKNLGPNPEFYFEITSWACQCQNRKFGLWMYSDEHICPQGLSSAGFHSLQPCWRWSTWPTPKHFKPSYQNIKKYSPQTCVCAQRHLNIQVKWQENHRFVWRWTWVLSLFEFACRCKQLCSLTQDVLDDENNSNGRQTTATVFVGTIASSRADFITSSL